MLPAQLHVLAVDWVAAQLRAILVLLGAVVPACEGVGASTGEGREILRFVSRIIDQ